MANEVYTRALGAMQSLVSARAASRALNSALKARGETPDTVDAEGMSRILLGPILSEFETILPREGLKRQLRSLAANLRKNFPKPVPAEPEGEDEAELDAHVADVEDARQVVADEDEMQTPEVHETEPGFVYQTNALSEVPESLDLMYSATNSPVKTPSAPQPQGVIAAPQPEEARDIVSAALESGDLLGLPEELLELPDSFEPEVPEPETSALTPTSSAPEASSPSVSQEQLEAAVLRFAQLEGVKFVAALRPDGEVAAQRGSGMDVAALAQLGLVGLKLLRRSGPLRTYYLAHTRGQLFLLPFGGDTLTLVGTPELNVGAIFNTFTSLEEER